MNNKYDMVLLMTLAFFVSGCSTNSGGLTERESGALLGGGLGAGTGAIIGHQTGHAGAGTAIGAGAGALAGALAGEGMRRSKEETKQEMRQEMMQQQYQHNQPTVTPQQTSTAAGEVPVKYNPKTGQTFPGSYDYDPNTGEKLEYIKK